MKLWKLLYSVQNKNEYLKKTISYCKYNKEYFLNELSLNQFFSSFNSDNSYNLHTLSEQFAEELKKVVNSMVITRTFPYQNCEWFNSELRYAKNVKINLYKTAVTTNTLSNWQANQQYRNYYKRQIELSFITEKIQNANNQKEMWRQLKKHVLKTNKDEISLVKFEDCDNVTNNAIIAEKLNNFFIKSICDLSNSVIFCNYSSLVDECNIDFKFNMIDTNDIVNTISVISTKSDFNYMNTKMLKDSIEIVGPVFVRIINTSFNSGFFPKSRKESHSPKKESGKLNSLQ